MSPSGELSTSDAGPTALPNSYSNAPLFPASFDSDTVPDPLLLEMEIAREELAANEQTIDGSRRMTISYEEALQREMEYQKRDQAIMSQHQVENMSLPTPFQELPPKASSVGIKRNLLSIELEPSPGVMHHSTLPPEQLQDGQDVPHILEYREPSPKQLHDQPFSMQQSLYQHSKVKPGQQQLHGRQPLPHRSLDDQPSSFQELDPEASPVGIKRKTLSIKLVRAYGAQHETLLPEQLHDCQDAAHPLNYREPSLQQLQDRQHLVQHSLYQHSKVQPEQQQVQGKQSLPHQSLNDQPSSSQELRTRPAEHLQCRQPLQIQRTPPVQHLKQQNAVPDNRPPPPQQQQPQDRTAPLLRQPQRQPLPPLQQQSQDWRAPLLRRPQGQTPPPQQQHSQDSTAPLFRQSQEQPPPLQQQQSLEFAPPLLRLPQEQPPPSQQQQSQDFAPPLHRQPQGVPNYQENPVWCNLCKIKCVTHFNLKIHCRGKKHRAKYFEVFGRKMGRSSF